VRNVLVASAAVLSLATALFAQAPPPGFQALGKRLPVYARDLKVPAGWKDVTPASEPMPEIKASEKKAGYIFYSRNPISEPQVYHTPYRFEVERSVAAFAARGEYEPVGFCVRPLDDLADAMLTVSDLRGPGGRTLGRGNIDVRQLWIRRTAVNRSRKTYKLVPYILESARPTAFKAGVTRHYWVTFYVPKDAAPGLYRGKATFGARGRPSSIRDITLRALPFELDPPGIDYGIFYGIHKSWLRVYRKDEVYPQNRMKHLIDQREHGMQHATIMALMGLRFEGEGKGLVPVFDPRAPSSWHVSLDDELRTAKQAGFDKFPCIWTGNADVEIAVGALRAAWRKNRKLFDKSLIRPHNWLFDRVYEAGLKAGVERFRAAGMKPPLCFVVDESGNSEERRKICDRYLAVVKKLGYTTTLTINGWWNNMDLPTRYKGKLDVAVHNDIFGQFVLDKDRAAGVKQVWIYNIASRTDALQARMRFGWYMLRIGAAGATQWVYQWPKKKNMYDDLTTNRRGSGEAFAYPTPEGPLPVVGWEGYREGVDDARYVRTLDRVCREKEKTMPRAVALARKELAETIARFSVDERKPVTVVSPDTAQKWRGRVAWHILRLTGKTSTGAN